MPSLPKDLRAILWGNPFGEIYPPKANPPGLPEDGRTIALRVLRRYIAALVFYRLGPVDAQGAREAPIPFRIPAKDILIEWPDNEDDLEFPSIVFLSQGPAQYATIGLVSYVEESTRDVYGKGTVLQWMSEYTEKFSIDIWASKRSERRSILAGIETALSPTEQMSGLRFRMPDYFNELVCFTIDSREIFDEPDSARNRRHGRITVEMRFNIVALVNYVSITPSMTVRADGDQDTNLAIVLDPNEPTDARPLLGIGDSRPNTLPRGPLGPTTPFDDEC